MEHVAIDLGGKESQICVRDPSGKIVFEDRMATGLLPEWFKDLPRCRLIVESSCEAFAIAEAARESGHEVRVVPSMLVRSLGVGARRVKTDRRDARALSEVSTRVDLGSVHIPQKESRERKAICSMREVLTETRTKLINSVRGWLRGQLARIRTGAVYTFPTRVREKVSVPPHVERQLRSIEQLCDEIKEADKELLAIAQTDPLCQLLMTAPGVGPVTAVRFLAAIDRVDRFNSAHEVESYLGLTPGEDSSSMRLRRTSITKAGSSRVRWALVQASWVAMRCSPNDPMVEWARRVAERRGRAIAAVALARKLAGILFAMLRDGIPYNPVRGAAGRPTTAEDLSRELRRARHF
jgi:transposase